MGATKDTPPGAVVSPLLANNLPALRAGPMGEAMETQIRGGKVSVVGGFNGTSVVQTPLTNSRLTDPESFKYLFPVRLES